jgi:hypothetical protein
MADQCRSTTIRALIAGVVALAAMVATPNAAADGGNPGVTCHGATVDGVEQDVCVGNPDAVAGVNTRDVYPGVVPRLCFGIGLGIGGGGTTPDC